MNIQTDQRAEPSLNPKTRPRIFAARLGVAALTLLAIFGCFRIQPVEETPSGRNQTFEEQIATPETLDKVGQDATRPPEETSRQAPSLEAVDLTTVGKSEFVRVMKLHLQDLDQRYDALQERATLISAAGQGRWKQTWNTLQRDRAKLQSGFDELQQARDSLWQDFRPSVMATHQMILRNLERAGREVDYYIPASRASDVAL